eukprot:gene11887-15905_t
MDFDDIPDADDEVNQVAVPPIDMLPDPDPIEEDALTKFNKAWNAKLELKRAAEYEHEKTVRAKAAEDLLSWNTQRDIRLTAKKDSNRSEEQVSLEALESEVEVLKTWERVTKLIDNNDPVDAKGSDVSRMRKLFIQLKNEPLEITRLAAAEKA